MNERNKSAAKRFGKVFLVLNGIIAVCQGLSFISAFLAAYVPSKRVWAFLGIATPAVMAVWKWCVWHEEQIKGGEHQAEAELAEGLLDRLFAKKKKNTPTKPSKKRKAETKTAPKEPETHTIQISEDATSMTIFAVSDTSQPVNGTSTVRVSIPETSK